jgi:phosphoribosyl 1,2-cyclic phosphodiesterase
MKATIWGCRGSVASPGPDTVRYGGNTPCVEVRLNDGAVIVLDAGTGIRALGARLAADPPPRIDLLLSHLHLDHLQGLGFFRPLFMPGLDIHLWGPRSPLDSLESRISRYLSPPLFPVQLSDLQALVTLHDIPDAPWQIGGATLVADLVSHKGPTLGYRIEEAGRCLTYIPDHEPGLGLDLATIGKDWISGFRLAAEADILVHDAQYSEAEYLEHRGWGHSSIAQVVTLARRCAVRRLVLFHHDPFHTDSDLEVLQAEAKVLWGGNGSGPELAFEGMVLDPARARGF